MKRCKTDYPGVFYREVDRIGGRGTERVYYVVYKKAGKVIEAKAGRQFADDMTPARASKYRAALIEGRDTTRQERRQAQKAVKEEEEARWTVGKLWDLYCATFPNNKVIRHEKRKFDNYIREEFGDKEPSQVLPLDVDRLRLRLQKAGKNTTAARVLEILRRTINFGVKRGLVPPVQFKIEVPKLNNETTEDLDPEQLQSLLEAMNSDPDQRTANLMRLALFTGMRRSEMLKLKWQDIDFQRGFIRLVDPKGGKDQVIPMNQAARDVFASIERDAENPFVFTGRLHGTHLTECRVSLTRIRAAANLPKDFRPLHGLRHVYASMLASSGQVDMYTLQKLLTHKSPMMTQRYSHLRDDALRKASNLAGDIINQAANGKTDGKIVNLTVAE